VEDTIAALATAAGEGAIAVVRLSGRDAVAIASQILLSQRSETPLPLQPSHRARLGRLCPPGEAAIDLVLALPMLAPASFTGEDVVEIHCHGGTLLPDLALRAALAAGARAALPGEFTERAFLNGRLDLCQAEAVADLVQASSEAGISIARQQLEGLLSQEILAIRDLLLDARALAEAHLDFPEDDLPPEAATELGDLVAAIDDRLARLVGTYARGRLARQGARVVLVGRPNAGKSSLMNALLGRERAIVNAEAGTTRDYLEEPLALGPVRLLLIDTAGLRQSDAPVERAGVERSRLQMESADLVLVLLDCSRPLDDQDRAVLRQASSQPRILVRSKADLPPAWGPGDLPLDGRAIDVSAHARTGLDELGQAILAALPQAGGGSVPRSSSEPISITRARHHAALVAARRALESIPGHLRNGGGALDLVSCELQSACTELERLVGMTNAEDVLDRIFRRFCVGK
jgi:tRNA modification GTPase